MSWAKSACVHPQGAGIVQRWGGGCGRREAWREVYEKDAQGGSRGIMPLHLLHLWVRSSSVAPGTRSSVVPVERSCTYTSQVALQPAALVHDPARGNLSLHLHVETRLMARPDACANCSTPRVSERPSWYKGPTRARRQKGAPTRTFRFQERRLPVPGG